MRLLKEEEYKRVMSENQALFGEFEKVQFEAKVNGQQRQLKGTRAIDNADKEYFIVKTENKGFVYFSTEEVQEFVKLGTGKYDSNESNNATSTSKIQETIALKIKIEKDKEAEESRNMANDLTNQIGYFPLVKLASVSELVISFYNKEQELMDTVVFPFIKGETYEVYSHEDERDIEFNSLVIDTSIAMDEKGNDTEPNLFKKYYETYNAIQDLEFIPDNQYTKEIFTLYKLDEKFAKVVCDLNKHDLLNLVTEYSNDPTVKQAALELRTQKPKQKIKMS